MTEAEWLAATDPRTMLEFLRGTASDRKLRLFACGFCHQIDSLLKDEDCIKAVEVAERFADGRATEKELANARHTSRLGWATGYWECMVAAETTDENAWKAAMQVVGCLEMETIDQSYWTCQCAVLRDVFGPVPRGVRRLPDATVLGWNGGVIVALADAAYEERLRPSGKIDPARLALLADALEDAGCSDAEVLGHLRGPGPHVRGCWAVDLLLARK
jgi:hypothetical protein